MKLEERDYYHELLEQSFQQTKDGESFLAHFLAIVLMKPLPNDRKPDILPYQAKRGIA